MSDAVTHRTLDDILRRLEQLEALSRLPYVTGTYLPTYLGSATPGTTTYTLREGYWTRIGGVIVVSGIVVWTAATGTGTAQISLPFAPNAARVRITGSLRTSSVTFANSTPQMILSSSALFTMDSPLTNAVGTAVAIEAAGNVVFTLAYFV